MWAIVCVSLEDSQHQSEDGANECSPVSCLVLTATLCRTPYHHPRFLDEETGAQR